MKLQAIDGVKHILLMVINMIIVFLAMVCIRVFIGSSNSIIQISDFQSILLEIGIV